MRRRLLFCAAAGSALLFSACQAGTSSDRPSDAAGVEPYPVSEEGEALLNAYGLSMNSGVFRFYLPEEECRLNIRVYRLAEDGSWEAITGSSLYSDGEGGEFPDEGSLSLVFRNDQGIDKAVDFFHVTTSAIPGEMAGLPGVTVEDPLYWNDRVFLEDFIELPFDAEQPVALAGYCLRSNPVDTEISLDQFFTPETLADFDLVQAVTVKLTEGEEYER